MCPRSCFAQLCDVLEVYCTYWRCKAGLLVWFTCVHLPKHLGRPDAGSISPVRGPTMPTSGPYRVDA